MLINDPLIQEEIIHENRQEKSISDVGGTSEWRCGGGRFCRSNGTGRSCGGRLCYIGTGRSCGGRLCYIDASSHRCYRLRKCNPHAVAPVHCPPIDDSSDVSSQSLGVPGFARGAVGNGKQTPVRLPVGNGPAVSTDFDVSPQEFGTSNHPFTTKRVDLPASNTTTNSLTNGVSLRWPYRITGKLFFNIGTSTYVCSASLIKRGVIVTAAHCVANYGKKQFYTNWRFVPAYYNGLAPYGAWSVNGRWVTSSYYNGTDTCSTPGIGLRQRRRRSDGYSNCCWCLSGHCNGLVWLRLERLGLQPQQAGSLQPARLSGRTRRWQFDAAHGLPSFRERFLRRQLRMGWSANRRLQRWSGTGEPGLESGLGWHLFRYLCQRQHSCRRHQLGLHEYGDQATGCKPVYFGQYRASGDCRLHAVYVSSLQLITFLSRASFDPQPWLSSKVILRVEESIKEFRKPKGA